MTIKEFKEMHDDDRNKKMRIFLGEREITNYKNVDNYVVIGVGYMANGVMEVDVCRP